MSNTPMSSHDLAKKLLLLPERPLYHHYWYQEDFQNSGDDWFHEVYVTTIGDKMCLTTGETYFETY